MIEGRDAIMLNSHDQTCRGPRRYATLVVTVEKRSHRTASERGMAEGTPFWIRIRRPSALGCSWRGGALKSTSRPEIQQLNYPGAELIAGGDIIVMGTLRGVAHAGVPDDGAAIIAALSLKPTQLRIGHFISRSPELQEKHDAGPEIARVDAEQIVVDSFPRRLLGAS